jgi:hypothetical protein
MRSFRLATVGGLCREKRASGRVRRILRLLHELALLGGVAHAAPPSAAARGGCGRGSTMPPPHELRVLLRAMPKGADLHNHMGGSVYAEDFMRWAGEKACASMLPRWPSPRPARRVSP